MAKTMLDKIWERHEVHDELLYIDLHLVHEVTSPQAFESLRLAGRKVRRPDRTLATADHNVPTDGATALPMVSDPLSRKQIGTLEENCAEFGIPLHSIGSDHQGIVHVIGPELGVSQPGMTIVCGDSHTSTHGAFGALAFGIGTSEVEHVLATQTLQQRKPRSMRISYSGELPPGVTAKDLILATIGRIGVDGGVGHVIEYSGPAIQGLSMEGRMTVCNMTIEGGGRAGMVAPDDTTFEWVEGRPGAPEDFEAAVEDWRGLPSDEGASFDTEVEIDAGVDLAAGELGHEPGDGGRRDRSGARAAQRRRPARARVHGPRGGHADPGHPARPRLRGLLHQLAHRRPARRGRGGEGPPGGFLGRRHGGSRLGQGEGPGRGRGARRGLPGRRLRLALGGLLDVPRDEPGHAVAGRALRLDLEPQLRGPSGPRRAHPPGQPSDGRRRRDRGALRGHQGVVMRAVTVVEGPVSVLDRDDVDTDQIMPKQFLKRIERTGFGEFLFHDWAKADDWHLPSNPILATGRNFGCGSSREHAPWGLEDYGFQAIVAPSYSDIFYSNCTKIGLLPVVLPEDEVRAVMAAGHARIDLDAQTVTHGDAVSSFEIDPGIKHRLLNGLDDIGVTLEHHDKIAAYEQERERVGPSTDLR